MDQKDINTSGKSRDKGSDRPNAPPAVRFPADEEAQLLNDSNNHKATGNQFFATSDFSSAISTYDKALAVCPTYLDYEVAVLRSNISACHLRLQEWKEAVDAATEALFNLDKLEGVDATDPAPEHADDGAQVQELTDEQADRLLRLEAAGHSLSALQRLRTKILLRRARGREGLDGWANLAGALEDYQTVLRPPLEASLAPLDKKSTQDAVRRLQPKIDQAKEREMGEMMGKLKDLGNGLLKPFGLSTDNFQFTKDQGSGGYSMNFKPSS